MICNNIELYHLDEQLDVNSVRIFKSFLRAALLSCHVLIVECDDII
jgi:hypothetical protein